MLATSKPAEEEEVDTTAKPTEEEGDTTAKPAEEEKDDTTAKPADQASVTHHNASHDTSHPATTDLNDFNRDLISSLTLICISRRRRRC